MKKTTLDLILSLADDEIIEEMESERWYDNANTWYIDYCDRHYRKYGVPFELAKDNGTY